MKSPLLRITPLVLFGISCSAVCAPPNSADPRGMDDASPSASLANVSRFEDATPADLAADSTYLLPGFIDKDITLANLRLRFGAANVKRADIEGAEGETSKGVILFANDASRRAELFFRDETRERGVAAIRVHGRKSRWHFNDGVHLGMTLDQLVALNGKPITFSGLDWDYGGAISDWHGGKIAQRDNADPAFSVSLSHGTVGDKDIPLGEGDYRSDDVHFPKQGTLLFVAELNVAFADPDATQ